MSVSITYLFFLWLTYPWFSDPYYNPNLYEVEVEITSKSYCRQRYDPYEVMDSMVCAGGVAGQGICAVSQLFLFINSIIG